MITIKHTLANLKKEPAYLILAVSGILTYLLILLFSKYLLNIFSSAVPAYVGYLILLNTFLSLTVLKKDRFAAKLLVIFNIILEIIWLICIIKITR